MKRRREKTVFGFNIDPRSGYWAKAEDEESGVDVPPDVILPVRIVPIVRDRKNALLFRFSDPGAYTPETITTLHHALLRGIEVVFQLEEGEILGEPLPARDNRRSILAYEATEGGAGVLNRLVEDPTAIRKVVKAALTLMHFDKVEEAVATGEASILADRTEEACVRGCYRCLLSYFNQPDHEMIDRSSLEAKQLLVDLARGELVPAASTPSSSDIDEWKTAFKKAGIPEPDLATLNLGDHTLQFVWRNHFVAASLSPLTQTVREKAETKGWTLFELPNTSADGVPPAMVALFKG